MDDSTGKVRQAQIDDWLIARLGDNFWPLDPVAVMDDCPAGLLTLVRPLPLIGQTCNSMESINTKTKNEALLQSPCF